MARVVKLAVQGLPGSGPPAALMAAPADHTEPSRLFDLPIETETPADLLRRIIAWAERDERKRVAYVNAHVINPSFDEPEVRQALLESDLIPGDLDRLFPICTPGASDSASFDEVLELLHMGGRSLPHSVLMMVLTRFLPTDDAEAIAQLERLTEPFYRTDSARQRATGG